MLSKSCLIWLIYSWSSFCLSGPTHFSPYLLRKVSISLICFLRDLFSSSSFENSYLAVSKLLAFLYWSSSCCIFSIC